MRYRALLEHPPRLIFEVEPGWIAVFYLRAERSGPLISRLELRPDGRHFRRGLMAEYGEGQGNPLPPGGITAGLLRRVGVPVARRFAADAVAWWARVNPAWAVRSLPAEWKPLIDEAEQMGRGLTRRERLAVTAAAYVSALGRGEGRRLNVVVGQELGRRPEQVRDDLHAARAAGLLTGGGSGRVGGTLTREAEAILEALNSRKGER